MAPATRRSVRCLMLAVGAVATAALIFLIGPRTAAVTLAPVTLMLLSLMAGAAVAFCIERAHGRPVDRYRRRHELLAGPRSGARLG